jgi:hypothetical protein
MKVGQVAIISGVSYTLLIGFFVWPVGLGAAISVIGALLWLLAELRRQAVPLPGWLRFLAVSAAVDAAGLVFTTNQLVVVLSRAHILAVLLLLLAARASNGAPPALASGLLREIGELLMRALPFWLRPMSADDLRGVMASDGKAKAAPHILRGLLFGLGPLICFHLLFAEVNQRYAAFVAAVLDILFDWEFWRLVLQGAAQSWLLYGLLRVKIEKRSGAEVMRTAEWCYALLPCLALFALFSYFQAEYLGMDILQGAFKELSLYVQRGFWELVAAALLGYLFWAAVAQRGQDPGGLLRMRRLLRVFALELALIAVFVMHKVVLHQAVFGLKDTRIAATLGAIVALVTFAMCAAQTFDKLTLSRILPAQLVLTAVFITGMSLANVDRLLTTIHPIRYRVGAAYHPDLAYLLMNSFDNWGEWGGLMLGAIEQGIPAVDQYYWGRYTPLCRCARGASGQTARVNYFRRHLQTLQEQSRGGLERVRAVFRYNMRIADARLWVSANKNLVQAFDELVEKECHL